MHIKYDDAPLIWVFSINTSRILLIMALSYLLLACHTKDGVMSFENGLLSAGEYSKYMKRYTLVDIDRSWHFSFTTNNSSLKVYRNGLQYEFEFTSLDSGTAAPLKASGKFLLFKIPGQEAVCLSSPRIVTTSLSSDGNEKEEYMENFYVILRLVAGRLYVWLVGSETPVAEGVMKSSSIDDTREFLAGYADAYTQANLPTLVFQISN